jgi:hypothetical protein
MLKHGAPLPNSSRKGGVIMGGNRWQHTALDHQNYYEWRHNDVLSRWREVRHCYMYVFRDYDDFRD